MLAKASIVYRGRARQTSSRGRHSRPRVPETPLLLGGAAERPRRASEPLSERPAERARVFVAEQKRHLRYGELAVAQERRRHLAPELREQRRERRPLLTQLALERPSAHAQRAGHTLQGGNPFAQLGPEHVPPPPPPPPPPPAPPPPPLR